MRHKKTVILLLLIALFAVPTDSIAKTISLFPQINLVEEFIDR